MVETSTTASNLEQQLEAVFREHARMIYRTARGVTGRHDDAEDVLQNVFLKLVRQPLAPDFTKSPKAYLYRAAVNASIDIVRRRKAETLNEGLDRIEAPPSHDVDERESRHRLLYESIAELNPDAAQIVILRYMHNQSDAEIARFLGVSRGAIALKLFRSRARLRKLISARLGDQP
jgi:RNA polymerase sigma-70 factor (ECF subfamily)